MSQEATQEQSPTFLRIALGFVYFQFGVLKFFPDLSPAETLGTQTVMSVCDICLMRIQRYFG